MRWNNRIQNLRTFLFIGLTCYGATFPTAVSANTPVVAVFELKSKNAPLKRSDIAALTEYLSILLVESGRYQVVPRNEIKRALTKEKSKSYRECYDESCQIEIGKELAAEKSVAGTIAKLGTNCLVTLKLFDLRKSTQEKAGSMKGKCSKDAITESVESAVNKMLGKMKPVSRNTNIGAFSSKESRTVDGIQRLEFVRSQLNAASGALRIDADFISAERFVREALEVFPKIVQTAPKQIISQAYAEKCTLLDEIQKTALNLSPPSDLSYEQMDTFQLKLEEFASPIMEKAIICLQKAVKFNKTNGIENEWSKKVLQLARTYDPENVDLYK